MSDDQLLVVPVGLNNQNSSALLLLNTGDSAMIVNLSTTVTLWVGNNPALTTGYQNAVPLQPLAYLVIKKATAPIYGVTQGGAQINVAVIPGGESFFTPQVDAVITGPVTVTGTVTATISGPVTVNGAVTATISGTPSVTITGTPNVAITGAVTFNNTQINVTGIGGYISPGQLASVFTLPAGGVSAGPGVTTALATAWDVSTYASVIFGQSQTSCNSVAAGAAVCSVWKLTWQDTSGNVVATDVLSTVLNGIGVWEIPVRGAHLTASLFNPGTVGTVSNANTGSVYVDGSYRVIPNIRAYNNISSTTLAPTINGCTVLSQPVPAGAVNGWVCNVQESFPAAAVTYLALLGLWAGAVTGSFWITPTALSQVPTIVDLTYAVQGGVVAGNTYPYGLIYEAADTAGTNPSQISINLPPTQCALIFQTPATAGHLLCSLIGVPN